MKYTIDDGENKVYTLDEIDSELILTKNERTKLEKLEVEKTATFGDGLAVKRVE